MILIRCFPNLQYAVENLTELCERGEEMIKNYYCHSHSIETKCSELQDIYNDLNKKFDERKHNLDKSTEVHESLQQVGKLCLVLNSTFSVNINDSCR